MIMNIAAVTEKKKVDGKKKRVSPSSLPFQNMLLSCGASSYSFFSIFLYFSKDQFSTVSLQRCFCDLWKSFPMWK